MKNKLMKIAMNTIMISFSTILLWIIVLGIFDYDKVIYEFNSLAVIMGIFIYITLIILTYKKSLPRIENNKILPIILLRYICAFVHYSRTSI